MKKNFLAAALPVFLILLSASSSEAQTIFRPSSENCRPYLTGSFKFCSAAPVTVPFSKVSPSTLDLLAGMPVENSLSYKLFCPSFPDAQPVDLSTGGRSQTLFASGKAVAESLKETVSLADLPSSAYLFTPRIKKEATVEASCLMEVISNVSAPNLPFLKGIAGLLKEDLRSSRALAASLERASELPAIWSALSASTETIESSATSIDFEKSLLESELGDLSNVPESELSAEEIGRRDILPSVIEQYGLISGNLRKAKGDIAETLKLAEKCGTASPDAFCIASVTRLVGDLKESISAREKRAREFSAFLSEESARLREVSKRLSKQLSDLALELGL